MPFVPGLASSYQSCSAPLLRPPDELWMDVLRWTWPTEAMLLFTGEVMVPGHASPVFVAT
jgi:hypothetical protein